MIPHDFRFGEGAVIYWFLLLIPLALIALKGAQDRLNAYRSFLNGKGDLLAFRGRKALFFLAGVVFSLLALLRPEGDLKPAKSNSNQLQLYILMDASFSMGVKDALGGISRLERAREIADRIIEGSSNTLVALDLFTDRLIPVVPLTQDRFFVRFSLRDVGLREGGYFGTDFAKILEEFKVQIAEQPFSGSRAVLILSDGEDTTLLGESEAVKSAVNKKLEALSKDLSVIAVRIGTTEGGNIPAFSSQGNPVLSKTDDRYLKSMAGKRFLIDDSSASDTVLEQLRAIQKSSEIASSSTPIATQYFQIPLLMALVCFLFAFPKEGQTFLFVLTMGFAAHLYSFEVWEQDKISYNRAVELLQKGNSEDALDLLNAISPQAYAFPIFRSRIAINQALARLNIGEKEGNTAVLEEGLLLLHLFQMLPCEPKSLCSPGLQNSVEEGFKLALNGKSSEKKDTLTPLPLIRLVAMMPDRAILERVSSLLPQMEIPSKQSELIILLLEFLRKENPKNAVQALQTMAESVFALSFLQLTADPGKEKEALMEQFNQFAVSLNTFQRQAFLEGKCQCAPWDSIVPMIAESGGMLKRALSAGSSEESYRYLNSAGVRMLEALFVLRTAKEKSPQDDRLRRDLQEMEQLDRKPQAPLLHQVTEGKPW